MAEANNMINRIRIYSIDEIMASIDIRKPENQNERKSMAKERKHI